MNLCYINLKYKKMKELPYIEEIYDLETAQLEEL